ncbi:MAG: hydantoinase/oxoprolinase family protein, partial [Magnetovibrio sp.]|nr:hydantoinase/oxoprolinase family protein [Magnetovibrio sp.]
VERPTITDADVHLGRIDPDRFAGGQVPLRPERSAAAIEADIGGPLGLSPHMAAFGITEMVDETMANAARVHAVELGRTASDYALIAFGGAAPLHVGRLAEKLGIGHVVVPTDAGVGSAIGFLRAPVAYEVVRSRNTRLRNFDAAAINDLFAEMRAEARAVVKAGAPGSEFQEGRLAYMRYLGQGHEIAVPLPLEPFGADGGADTLQALFDREYGRLYARTLPNAEVEVLTWALTLATADALPAAASAEAGPDRPAEAAGERRIYDPGTGELRDIPLYWRPDLAPGDRLAGPAVIAEDQTSTFVPASFDARIAGNGYILLDRRDEAVS